MANTGGVMKVIVSGSNGTDTITVNRTITVKEVLEKAGYDTSEVDIETVRLQGKEVGWNTRVKAGNFLAILAPVSGGIR